MKTYYGIERAKGSHRLMNGTVYQKIEHDGEVVAIRKYDGVAWDGIMRFEGSSMGELLIGKPFSEITYSGIGSMVRLTDTEGNKILCAPPNIGWEAPKQFNLRWMNEPILITDETPTLVVEEDTEDSDNSLDDWEDFFRGVLHD